MARFRFKLQTLLEQREREETQRQREFAHAHKRRQELEAELMQISRTIQSSRQALGRSLVGRVDMTQVGAFARYSGQSSARAHALVRKIAKADEELEKARRALMEARRQHQAIEQLRDRAYQTWLAEQRRREQREQDERAAQAFVRGKPEWSK